MAVIDRNELVDDAEVYLPDANVLSEDELLALANHVVDYKIPANDDIYYSEALCKLLLAAGKLNASKATVDISGKKKEKAGGVEIERFSNTGDRVWDNYLKSLVDICPLLPKGGYQLTRAIGIQINAGAAIVVNDCPDPSELIL